jgi:hypothetical protein
MSQILRDIITPQLQFEGADNSERFLKQFFDLYRIEIFKDGLDLILTKLKEKHLRFEIKIIKGWDTNVGCFLTEQRGIYNQTVGKFFFQRKPKIILKQLSTNVLAHEMAHALEFESGLDLGEDFRKCVGFDMKDRDPTSLTLKAQKNRLMIEALKSYPPEQFISELFARYFELLSISRNVQANGDFTTAEVMDFFANTTNFVTQIFNPKIRGKINPKIAQITAEIVAKVKLTAPEQKFQERVDSRQAKTGGSWTKSINSNASWQKGWEKHKNLIEEKNNG